MAAIVRIIAVGCLLAGVLGCGPRMDLEGVWLGSRTLMAPPGTDPSVVKSLSKIVLKIGPPGRFELFDEGMPKGGSVSYSDGHATLKVDIILGRDLARQPKEVQDAYSKPIDLEPKPDGTLLITNPNAADPGPIVLRREATP